MNSITMVIFVTSVEWIYYAGSFPQNLIAIATDLAQKCNCITAITLKIAVDYGSKCVFILDSIL